MCKMSLPVANAPPSQKKIKEDFVKKMTMDLIFSVILVLKLLAVWVHLEEEGRFDSLCSAY